MIIDTITRLSVFVKLDSRAAVKAKGKIELDTLTTLEGIPAAAWDYRLGNRSALEWVLDRYKERKPRDPTIRQQFSL
ncbi:MAG: type ISP restriction/modification enzyme [Chloroflexota bacterium]|nr:type ISP restriction/modification enzyme [Chloroflexota bacterium]